MDFILSKKIKYYAKINSKLAIITVIALVIFMGIVNSKYRPVYAVSINNNILGYSTDKNVLEDIKKEIQETTNKNIENIQITAEAEFEKTLVAKSENLKIDNKQVKEEIKDNIEITYKYYEVLLNGKTIIAKVNNIDEASQIIDVAKSELSETEKNDVDLMVIEKFTEVEEEVDTENIDVAKAEIENTFAKTYVTEKNIKAEQERVDKLKDISGIKIAVVPVIGSITSRYGELSYIRSSAHTGLDIAAVTGTKISAACSGTVIFAGYNGPYGYMVKLDHGNGVETWYAHSSKLNVTVNQVVNAGDTIAYVGSTGNSTGPHLHFEVRKDGRTLNPEEYLYSK